MDKYLEKLLNELGAAINDAVQRSEDVSEIMERIRATGHEVMLTVEAALAMSEHLPEESEPFPTRSIEDRLREISSEDRKFLRSLNIKFDPDE